MYVELDAYTLLISSILHVSRIFLESTWQVMNHRQVTHHFVLVFGFWMKNHLAV